MQSDSNVGERIVLQSALEQAFYQGDLTSLKQLIEIGINLNQRLDDHETPLEQTVKYGDLDLVQMVIAGGADPNFEEDVGYSPLWRAASYGLQDVYDFLYPLTNPTLQQEAQLELPNGLRRRQRREVKNGLVEELTTAVMQGNIEEIQHLIESGVDLNAFDSDGNTALLPAVYNGKVEIVRILLQHGADPNKSEDDPPWMTPLWAATRYIEAVKANYSSRGFNPKDGEAVQIEIMRLLLQAGADANLTRDSCKVTPLMVAVDSQSSDAVELLLNAGAEVNTKDISQRTALNRALENKNAEIVQQLINAGAELSIY